MCVHLHSLPDRESKGYIYIRDLKKALTYSAYNYGNASRYGTDLPLSCAGR